jgi:hypothetical protein
MTAKRSSIELANLDEARKLAIETSGGMLKNGAGPSMWAGEPWRMWITDARGGGGKTHFTLTFTATDGEETPSPK